MKKYSIIVAVFCITAVSCTTKTGTPGTKAVINDKLTEGKNIYENSCGKCHDLPDPAKFSDEKWVGIMKWMAPKAKLNDEQSALVYSYVTSKN